MGKFIYLMDAYEDLPNDLEKGCYNPLKKIAEEEGYEERIKSDLMHDDSREYGRI